MFYVRARVCDATVTPRNNGPVPNTDWLLSGLSSPRDYVNTFARRVRSIINENGDAAVRPYAPRFRVALAHKKWVRRDG